MRRGGVQVLCWAISGLSAIFFVLSLVLVGCDMGEQDAGYRAAASALAALYLWGVSGLGYAGARAYGEGRRQSTGSLIAFMVMIVAFLSLFVAVASTVAHYSSRLPTALNVTGAALLFVFGIGSYMIEIIYLATEPHFQGTARVSKTPS